MSKRISTLLLIAILSTFILPGCLLPMPDEEAHTLILMDIRWDENFTDFEFILPVPVISDGNEPYPVVAEFAQQEGFEIRLNDDELALIVNKTALMLKKPEPGNPYSVPWRASGTSMWMTQIGISSDVPIDTNRIEWSKTGEVIRGDDYPDLLQGSRRAPTTVTYDCNCSEWNISDVESNPPSDELFITFHIGGEDGIFGTDCRPLSSSYTLNLHHDQPLPLMVHVTEPYRNRYDPAADSWSGDGYVLGPGPPEGSLRDIGPCVLTDDEAVEFSYNVPLSLRTYAYDLYVKWLRSPGLFLLMAAAMTSFATISIASSVPNRLVFQFHWRAASALFPLISRGQTTEEGRQRRDEIITALRTTPGLSFSDLRKRLKMGHGQIAHHLRRLEQEGQLWRLRSSRRVLFFLAEIPPTAVSDEIIRVMGRLDERNRALLFLVHDPLSDDGSSLSTPALAEMLDISVWTVRRRIGQLQRLGVLMVDVTDDGLAPHTSDWFDERFRFVDGQIVLVGESV